MSVDKVGFADQFHDPDGQVGCIEGLRQAGLDDREFVASEACDRVGCPHDNPQSPGDLPE
jgi:hypothetical protein